MKVFDVPHTIFFGLLPPTYDRVMNRLQLYRTLIKDAVPQRETYSKLKQNETFPLLGKQFIVMYDVKNDEHAREAFLCLLCGRKLSDDESYAHVFSQEHVKTFLDSFHPGSLTSGIDAETLLDLAKQAARIHPISNVQVIKLDRPIWEPCTYLRAKSILGSAKRKYMLEALEPIIKPKLKLVPRETVKEMTSENLRDNLQNNSYNQQTGGSINVIEESQNSQKPIDDSNIILKTKAVQPEPETIKHCIKTEEHEEEGAKNETLAASEIKSKKVKEQFTEMASGKMENTGGDTGQLLKVENTEALTTKKPNGGNAGNGQNREKDDCTKVENSEDYMFKNNQQSMPEKNKKDTGPDENTEKETAFKHQQPTPSEDTSCKELQKMPSSELKQATTADKESDGGKPSHEPAKDQAPCHDQLWLYIKKKSREPVVGLGAIYECLCEQHDAIYLCQCCSLITLEKNIIDHVSGSHHWKMYLMDIQLLPPQPQINEIRHLAEKFESVNGYGQAQVVELNEDVYNKILKQDFESALQTVKSLQTQKPSARELPLDTSITLQCQHEQIMTEKMQVVTLEIDRNSEDRMRHSLHTSKSGTNKPKMSEDAVAQSLNCEPLKMVITSKLQGTFQTSASSLGTGATAKVTEAKLDSSTITTSTAESSSSTTSNCTKAAITLRDTDNKSTTTTTSRSKDAVIPSSNLEPLKMVTTSKILKTSPTSATSGGIGATVKMTEAKFDSSKTTTSTAESSSSTTSNCPKAAITGDTDIKRKDAVSLSSNFEQLNMTDTLNILGTFQTSASSRATVTTSNLTTASITSPRASSSNCATFATKCRETTEKCGATIPSITTAKTNCTTNTTELIDTDYRSTSTTMSATAAKTSKSTAPTLSCPASSESKELSQSLAMTAAKKPKTSVMCEKAEISGKYSDSDVTTHIELNNPYTTTHRTTAIADGSEHKNPCTELSYTTISKTKPNENPPKVGRYVSFMKKKISLSSSSSYSLFSFIGRNYLIIVSCEGRRQVYCELCSVRLRNSSHTYSDVHRLNYLMKVDNVMTHLTEVEKDVTHRKSQCIQVKLDVYKELAALPEDKAIEKLKTMMRQRTLWETSSPTTTGAEALRQASSISPFEISSPDDDKNLSQSKLLGFSSNHQCEPGSKQELQKSMDKGSEANGLNYGQNPSLLSFKKNYPEHTPIIQQPNTAVTGNQENSGPGHQPVSQGRQGISAGPGTQSCSKLSTYLTVKKLETKPIIGMGSVWECQGISRNTFYLCESCKNTISVHDICQHMVSQAHQIQCMMKDYSQFLYFLAMDNVPQEVKGSILLDIAPMFSAQERFKRIDAQVVMLTHELYERVQAASFSEALKMVQKIKLQKLGTIFRPDMTLQQKEARHKPENHKTGVVIDSDEEAKNKNLLGPVDVSSALPHDLSTETYRISSIQPELTPRESQHQRTIPELHMKQAEEHSEPPPFCVNPKTSQTLSVSSTDAHIQSRKRPASPPFQSSYIANPHLTDPRQAKYARSQCSPDSTLETNPDKPATMTTLSSSEENGTEPGYDYTGPNKEMLVQLIDLVKKKKKDNLSNSNAFSANTAYQIDVEEVLSSMCVDADYRVKENASSSKS